MIITTAREIADTRQFDISGALDRSTPGVSTNDVLGNPFSPEVDFRGFVASPVSGTPEELAVYQNGVRINEAYGDTVNWDLIPTVAIDRSAIVTGNPLFGLNALGGAVVLDMKNGFTYQGFDLDGRLGSRNRRQTTMQYGVLQGDFASYLAVEAAGDSGYRKYSGSQVRRLYGDIGYRGDSVEVHFTLGLAQNRFGVSGPAPVDLVNNDTSAIYTTPQTNKNTLSQYDLNATFTPAPNWKILTDVHYRAFDQAHVDGNTTDLNSCGQPTLCDGNGNSTYLPDIFQGAANLGVIDRTWTRSRTLGGTVQIENTDKIYSMPNKFTFGVNYEHGWTNFSADEEVGVLNPGDLSVTGLGMLNIDPTADVQTVHLNAANSYLGVYGLDALDVTDKLTVTAGGRFNYAAITLYDLVGTSLNGSSVLHAFQPDDRRQLQAHARNHRLRQLFRGQSRADAVGAWLRQSESALPDRQFSRLRSAAQAGGHAFDRDGPARRSALSATAAGALRMERRRLSHDEFQRHSERAERRHGPWLFHQRRHHAAPGRRDGDTLQGRKA